MNTASQIFPLTAGEFTGTVEEAARGKPKSYPQTAALSAEQALVRDVQNGSRDAFTQLIAEHQRVVFGYLRARILDVGHAEDLTQEVFLRCYLQRERLSRGATVRSWLIGIARNVVYEHVRRQKRAREEAWTELCLEVDALVQDRNVPENELLLQLPSCLESLGKSARDALEMHYQSQLRLGEIGAKLCRSEGAVKLLLFRARQALRRCLSGKHTRPHF